MLTELDLYVCLKLATSTAKVPGYEALASELHIGLGSAHRAVEHLTEAALLRTNRKVNQKALLGVLVHAARYVYYVKPGELTRGMATAQAAPPLSELLNATAETPVWPDPRGETRGPTVMPLHKHAPEAARRDPRLYELLALVDTLRIGRAREVELAERELGARLTP